jgi:hypothetical protein
MGKLLWASSACALSLLASTSRVQAAPIVVGHVDTFEDGTTQGWMVNLLGMGSPPAPPQNIATGGPAGVDDNYLQLTSTGGQGAGSRLTALNIDQWTGDYTTAGVGAISMDLRNLGSNDLRIRLFLENPMGGPPTDAAITNEVLLPGGGGWTHAVFLVDAASLTTLFGDVNTLLSNVTTLRIYHAGDAVPASFPGPAIVAQLGVDNIAAAAVPEPLGLTLLGLAAAGIAMRRRRTR